MQQPYNEEITKNIRLNGCDVLMCNIPFNQSLIDTKYYTGYGLDVMGYDLMNVGFYDLQDRYPLLEKGDIADWQYFDETYKVQIIDSYKLFVKGINIQLYLVQFKESFLEE